MSLRQRLEAVSPDLALRPQAPPDAAGGKA
jgi:hypothetical protein